MDNLSKDGKGFIEVICQRLRDQDILLYDHNIRKLIETLNNGELNQIVSLGDVVSWHNERIQKQIDKDLI